MPTRNIFVCAAGHSGSTLLDILLGSHGRGFSLGEITQLPKNIALDSVCSCGSRISGCAFWRPFLDAFGAETNIDLWSDPYALDLGFINASDEIDHLHQTRLRTKHRQAVSALQYLSYRVRRGGLPGTQRLTSTAATNKAKLFRSIRSHADADFVVDSSKHYLEAVSLYLAAPEETRIVRLLRDGRAVFYSGLRRQMNPKDALSAWSNHWHRAQHIFDRQLPPEAVLTVRYEDLTASPERELGRLFDQLDVGMPPDYTYSSNHGRHIVNGNRMRFTADLTISSDDKWRRALGADMLEYFEVRAGELNRRLGYD